MSSSYRVTGAGPEAVGRISAWTLHLSALGALVLVLGALYWQTIAAAVTVWWVSPTFSHCFLIIPLSAYLIWGKRRELAAMTPVACPRALPLAIPVIAASFVGTLASINEIEQLAFIAFVQVLTLSLLGPRVYRSILFPSLYLFFLVPMGEYLIGPLQAFTTKFIDVWLNWLGILHYTEGNMIQLANGSYQVAEACAGLRFLIATIAVGALFAHFTYRKWSKIVLFMIACVIVPVIGNGFRALGIVLLAHFSDNKIAVGADHLVYGWGFSVVLLGILMFVGMKFADDFNADNAVLPPAVRVRPPHILPLTVLAALIAVSVVPAFAAWQANSAGTVNVTAFSVPPAIQGWSVGQVSHDWAPGYLSPDAKLEFAMRDADPLSPPVDVFVDYYIDEAEGHNLISSSNKMWDEDVWHPIIQGSKMARIEGQPVQFRELQIGSGGISRLIWWTYAAGGQYTTSGMQVKLHRVRTALMGGRGAALIAISTIVDSDLDAARAKLRRAAANLGPVKARIDGAKQMAER
jgi:exosortase A